MTVQKEGSSFVKETRTITPSVDMKERKSHWPPKHRVGPINKNGVML